jgi:hypothetical protein
MGNGSLKRFKSDENLHIDSSIEEPLYSDPVDLLTRHHHQYEDIIIDSTGYAVPNNNITAEVWFYNVKVNHIN